MMSVAKDGAQRVDITSLKGYRGNARRGNLDVIRESLRSNGQYRPIVVRTQTREVLAGNHTWEAAKLEGWTEIECWFISCDAKTARRINLVDNRAPELGGYDEEALIAQLGSVPDLTGTGWTADDRDKLTSGLIMQVGGDTEPDPVPESPKSRRGDLYLMRDHRLLCGDCTNEQEVARLMANEQPVCMWTDPPYLGPSDNSGQGDTAAQNVSNSVDSLRQMLHEAFRVADQHLAKRAAIYSMHPGGASAAIFYQAFVTQGWRLRQTLVWLKEAPLMGYHDYAMQHELIIDGDKWDPEFVSYGFTTGRAPDRDKWYGDRKQTSVLEFPRPSAKLTAMHPTIRPVGLVERLILNSTPRDALVYDPFAGSGTTLIAAENLGRRASIMELDPGYCDVIVDRWERHTGEKAKRSRRKGDG